jgi:amino acid permease
MVIDGQVSLPFLASFAFFLTTTSKIRQKQAFQTARQGASAIAKGIKSQAMSSSSAQHDEGEGGSAPPASSDDENDSRCTSSSDTSATWTVLHVPGSTVAGATFNFTNSVVGAGAIGLGGAIAVSGGAVSIACIIFFGILTKLSLDMLIELTVKTDGANSSYEDLGRVAYGTAGRLAVLISKTLYSFGCLVAYLIVIKDNAGPGLRNLLYRDNGGAGLSSSSWFETLLEREDLLTFVLSAAVILPLCLNRDMTTLSNFSIVSVFAMVAIVGIVILLWAINPNGEVRHQGGSTYENWFEIRPGLLESLGTFVFTFVSQHTVHLAYESLDRSVRTVSNWKKVSLFSILISTTVSLSVGVFVYMSFWQTTESDIFQMYPPDLVSIDIARLLLCVTMLLTFPLPFFTTREMIVLVSNDCFGRNDESEEMRAALLAEDFGEDDLEDTSFFDPTAAAIDDTNNGLQRHTPRVISQQRRPWLKPGEERQLLSSYHIALTTILWSATTVLAIKSPNLGDVLDLVGCATGTFIAFILPALFSFRLVGYTHLAAAILVIGGIVGSVGTYFSIVQFLE